MLEEFKELYELIEQLESLLGEGSVAGAQAVTDEIREWAECNESWLSEAVDWCNQYH